MDTQLFLQHIVTLDGDDPLPQNKHNKPQMAVQSASLEYTLRIWVGDLSKHKHTPIASNVVKEYC